MKKRIKFAIVFIVIILIACIIGFINAWIITGGIKMSDLTQEQQDKSEKVLVKNILLTETKEGKKYWEIFGKRGKYLNDSEDVVLYDVIGNFYNDKGQVILSFSGDTGEYSSKEKKIVLKKNTNFASLDETLMKADIATWEGTNNIIHAEGHIKAYKADELYITCDRTVFSTDFKDFKIYGHTITRIYEKGKK